MLPASSTRSLLSFLVSSALALAAGAAGAEPAFVQFGGQISSFQDVQTQPCTPEGFACPIAESGFFTIGDIVAGSAVWDPELAVPPDGLLFAPDGEFLPYVPPDEDPRTVDGTTYFETVRDFEATVFRQSDPADPYNVSFEVGGNLVRNDNQTRFGLSGASWDEFGLQSVDPPDGFQEYLIANGITLTPPSADDTIEGFVLNEAAFGIGSFALLPSNPSLLDSWGLPQQPDTLLDAGGDPFFLLGYDGSPDVNARGNAVAQIGFVESWEAATLTAAELGLSARLTTGSPTTFSQEIQTPDGTFLLSFDALLESPDAALSILLDGTQTGFEVDLSRLPVSGLLEVKVSVRDPSLLGRDDVELAFRVDGETGSSVRLDNIEISQDGTVLADALKNGDFETGDLAGWAVSASGEGGVTTVPEPATGALLAAGLGLVAAARRRR